VLEGRCCCQRCLQPTRRARGAWMHVELRLQKWVLALGHLYVFVCVCYVCAIACMRTCVHVHVLVCKFIYVCAIACVRTCVNVHVFECVFIYPQIPSCIHPQISSYLTCVHVPRAESRIAVVLLQGAPPTSKCHAHTYDGSQ